MKQKSINCHHRWCLENEIRQILVEEKFIRINAHWLHVWIVGFQINWTFQCSCKNKNSCARIRLDASNIVKFVRKVLVKNIFQAHFLQIDLSMNAYFNIVVFFLLYNYWNWIKYEMMTVVISSTVIGFVCNLFGSYFIWFFLNFFNFHTLKYDFDIRYWHWATSND